MGVLSFGLLHAAIITPIWTRLPGGVPFAIVAGVTMGWALYELQRRSDSHGSAKAISGWTFGALLWLTLIPMTLLGAGLRATGMHGADSRSEVVAECLLAVAAGAVAGRLVGRRWRVGFALGTASLAVTLTQAGPIPLMNSARAGGLFAGLMIVYICSGAALGGIASLVSRGLQR
jgi:hypothetical protein